MDKKLLLNWLKKLKEGEEKYIKSLNYEEDEKAYIISDITIENLDYIIYHIENEDFTNL